MTTGVCLLGKHKHTSVTVALWILCWYFNSLGLMLHGVQDCLLFVAKAAKER